MTSTRRQFVEKDSTFNLHSKCFNKESLSPTSTLDSQSPREYCHKVSKQSSFHQSKQPYQQTKQKSQLCKKFVQNGFCPYKKKCKFAHGSHELRKNDQVNSKYKTKECGVFVNEGCCMFGDRCNFIHKKEGQDERVDPLERMDILIDLGFLQVKTGVRSQSRLLSLLE